MTAGDVKCYSHLKTVWLFLKRLNMQLPCDPAVVLGVYLRDMTTYVHAKICA